MKQYKQEYHHPFIIRLTHWVNFIAFGIIVTSGLRIYNASPIWDFTIPRDLTLGGWLAGARQWHFFGMYLFVANGLMWVLYNIFSRHGRRTTILSRNDLDGVFPMILYYLRIHKEHQLTRKYNPLQKLAYTTVPIIALGGILSGIAIYWPVQFSGIASFFGGYDTARVWHFIFMGTLVLFFLGHIFMVAISGWSNFVSMITGWKKTSTPPNPP
ncbi:MAG: cytochrome b/b6 domain-containing protein [Ignavibacteriae bacterium]|nr:cytochrome b/b6 domain-containing protein [Ignavibacteriota bacterium]